MKVCTLTWYRGNNYGSVLQAYALRRAVEQMGCECDILAYRQSKVTALKKRFLYHNYRASVDFKINRAQTARQEGGEAFMRGVAHAFDAFRNEEMRFSAPCSTRRELAALNGVYDAFICGSDQIWNPYLFDAVYFLYFVRDDFRRIAYAPSFGVGTFPRFSNRRTAARLARIPHLSVREERGTQIVRALTGRDAPAVVDPSLLLDRAEWEALARPTATAEGGPYVFGYFLSRNPVYEAAATALAAQLGLPLRLIPMVAQDLARDGAIHAEIGPAEWLTLLRNAAFVITDSFHCTLFSLLFRRQFYVCQRFADGDPRGQNARVHHLLAVAALGDRLLAETPQRFEPVTPERFNSAEAALQEEIRFSRQWLENALNAVKKGSAAKP
jgi:hypothetical protein